MSRKRKSTAPAPAAAPLALAELPELIETELVDSPGEPRRRGRGTSKNHVFELADAAVSRCPKCGSTRRRRYYKRDERPTARTSSGEPCTHVVMRWTQCAEPACRQHRIDRSYENRISQRAAG
ncbi:MAG: hypothetical protein ACTHK7_21950 [Aureliella sp.]